MERLQTFTITFGDAAENHKGMQIIGTKAENGFTFDDLFTIKSKFEDLKYKCELVKLDYNDSDPASILIIRKGVNALLSDGMKADDLYMEHLKLDVDKKAFMYGRVVNKSARYNLCFSDFSQEPDYENKKGRIVNFKDVKLTNMIRKNLVKLSPKAENLQAEGNYYYDPKNCGISYHGDTERRKVIAIRIGKFMPLQYQWFLKGEAIGDPIRFVLEHGDIYIMSEKATGFDWKKKNILTLRHAAGAEKYLKIKPKKTHNKKIHENLIKNLIEKLE